MVLRASTLLLLALEASALSDVELDARRAYAWAIDIGSCHARAAFGRDVTTARAAALHVAELLRCVVCRLGRCWRLDR